MDNKARWRWFLLAGVVAWLGVTPGHAGADN